LLTKEKGVGNMNGRSKTAIKRPNPTLVRREMSAQGEWSRRRTKYSEYKIIARRIRLLQTPFSQTAADDLDASKPVESGREPPARLE
jgi:hypothetical protein